MEKKQRWLICRLQNKLNRPERMTIVMTVEGPGHTYRPLDDRTLDMLKACDHHRRGAKAVVEEMIEKQRKGEELAHKQARDQIEDIARDVTPIGGYVDETMGSRNVPKEDSRIAEKRSSTYKTKPR